MGIMWNKIEQMTGIDHNTYPPLKGSSIEASILSSTSHYIWPLEILIINSAQSFVHEPNISSRCSINSEEFPERFPSMQHT